MAPLSHSQEVQIQWGKLSIAVHRQSSQVARRLQQLNSSGLRSFPCFDLLRVYAEFFWVWHFLFVFFLFPTALPTAMLMPVSFCTVCALLVVSNMWGVCFAVFVQWETLCFVSVLHFPLVAVKVLWRFPLCKRDLWASSSSREREGKSDVIFSCAYFCFGVGTARLYLQLTWIQGYLQLTWTLGTQQCDRGRKHPYWWSGLACSCWTPVGLCVCTAWLPHTRLDAEMCSAAVRASSCLVPPIRSSKFLCHGHSRIWH